MTLPPTSYAPVDSRMIGGFCGLRPSSARAAWLSPASNNAAANDRPCRPFKRLFPRFIIGLLPKLRAPLLAVYALVLLGGVLRRRLAHRKIQEPCGVVADELPDCRPRHLQVEQDLRDAAEAIDRTLRALQAEIGRQDRIVHAGHLDQMSEIIRAVLQGFSFDEHADRMFHLDAAPDQLADISVVAADDVG